MYVCEVVSYADISVLLSRSHLVRDYGALDLTTLLILILLLFRLRDGCFVEREL